MPKNDFESTHFANFEELVHDAQLDQKILDGT